LWIEEDVKVDAGKSSSAHNTGNTVALQNEIKERNDG
jgi:hypothetical protein